MRRAFVSVLLFLLAPALLPLWQTAVAPNPSVAGLETAANPEMERLAEALAGDWNTVETMERSQFFPNGGSRRGVVQAHLAAGGNVLVYGVRSNGSAGKLDGFHTIWWDRGAKLYYFFACFNSPDHPCKMRGTAHWEGATLVNDYQEMVEGKKTRWRDSFRATPASHTLTAAMDDGNGGWRTLITTTATRR